MKSTGESATEIEEAWSTTLAGAHVGTGLAWATAVKKKGAKGVTETLVADQPVGYVAKVALTFLKRLCWETVILQTDGELAIGEWAEAVARARPKTVTRKTPAHSSQSDGAVDFCTGQMAGQIRTMRSERKVIHDVVISPDL